MSMARCLVREALRYAGVAAVLSVMYPGVAAAQALGTLQWQLAPYCNLVTLTVAFSAGVFRLEGSDDQCGGPAGLAPAIGTATLAGDTAVIGLAVTTAPSGTPVHLIARIDTATLNGSWSDSAGSSGTFVLGGGAASGGPRPIAGGVVAPTLAIASNSAIGGTLDVGSNGTIGGTLRVGGNGVVDGALNVSGSSTVGGSLNVAGNTAVKGLLEVGATRVAGTLSVGTTLPLLATLAVGGNASINGKVVRPTTGLNTNLVPIAFGYVGPSGFASNTTDGVRGEYLGSGLYVVDLGRPAYQSIVSVTPVLGPTLNQPYIAQAYIHGETKIGVVMTNLQGQGLRAGFYFVVYQP